MPSIFHFSFPRKMAAIPLIFLLIQFHSVYAVELKFPKETYEELDFKTETGLDGYESVEYRDTQGYRLDFAQFKRMLAGHTFRMEKRKIGGKRWAIIQLTEKETTAVVPGYKVEPGSKFPGFSLHSTERVLVNNEALTGHYTLISFYFSECAPCVSEVPMLNNFAEKHKDITTLAVTFDSAEEAKNFAKQTKFSWRILPGATNLIKNVGVQAYPTFALLDPNGNLVAIRNQMEIGIKVEALEKWVDLAMMTTSR